MKIYYDADCGICKKCKNFVLRFEKPPYRVGGEKMEFLNMHDSIYKNEIRKTIVVVEDLKGEKIEHRYGQAVKEIFKKLYFPINLFGYLPTFVVTFFYIILREFRKWFSKNICKI